MEIYRDESEEPPPATNTLRNSASSRILSSVGIRGASWFRAMVNIQHLSSPCPASRFRNDLVILETV